MRHRILVLDSDLAARSRLADFLSRHAFEVLTAASARQMDQILDRAEVDAVLLDLMNPGEAGLTACSRLRDRRSAPGVIVISAVADEADIVVGLEIGADDYVTKPYRPRELLARLRAVLRRREEGGRRRVEHDPSENYLFEGWRLIAATHQLFDPNDRTVDLSPAEFSLLRTLLAKPLEVVPRIELLPGAGGLPDARDFRINVAMSRLRRKLSRVEGGARLIRTVRHSGYLLTVPVERFSMA